MRGLSVSVLRASRGVGPLLAMLAKRTVYEAEKGRKGPKRAKKRPFEPV